jgi:hypothetical protein
VGGARRRCLEDFGNAGRFDRFGPVPAASEFRTDHTGSKDGHRRKGHPDWKGRAVELGRSFKSRRQGFVCKRSIDLRASIAHVFGGYRRIDSGTLLSFDRI